jgi:inosine-uridine nucleoside N-ribohydrolase
MTAVGKLTIKASFPDREGQSTMFRFRFFVISLLLSLSTLLGLKPGYAKTPVVLDTDIGDDIDDTWALALLLRSPELDVKLVTTTCGKAEYRAKLIARLLTVAGRSDIPIGLGEGGHKGTGGQQAWVEKYKLSDYPGKVHANGAEAIVDLIERSKEPVTVIAIGPLHTLAAVIDRRPSIAARACLVGMQGSVRKGYDGKAPSAEYNVASNAPAARKVLSAPWRQIAITPLDTCGIVTLSGKRFEAMKKCRDPLAQAVIENYRIWKNSKSADTIHESSVLFDTAAIYLAYPGSRPFMKLETLSIAVKPDGFTRIDAKGRKMAVATEWHDLDGFRDLLIERICGRK